MGARAHTHPSSERIPSQRVETPRWNVPDEYSPYTAIPRAIRALRGSKLSGLAQRDLIDYLAEQALDLDREHWQATRRHGDLWTPALTSTKAAKACGISAKTAEQCLADMAARGIIERERLGTTYRYRLAIRNWPTVPDYEPKPVKDEEPEAATPDEEPEAQAPRPPLVLMPNGEAKLFSLPKARKDFSVETRTAMPLAITCEIVAGEIRMVIAEAAREEQKPVAVTVEEKANHLDIGVSGSLQPFVVNTATYPTSAPVTNGNGTPRQTPAPEGLSLPELIAALDDHFLLRFGSSVPPKIAREVHTLIDDRQKLTWLNKRIAERGKAMRTWLLLPGLARDAAEAAAKAREVEERERAHEERASEASRLQANYRAYCDEMLASAIAANAGQFQAIAGLHEAEIRFGARLNGTLLTAEQIRDRAEVLARAEMRRSLVLAPFEEWATARGRPDGC